jgi:glutamyl-tRNA synthetase
VLELPITPRLRFAPSPTGRLHVGNLRTALFNYLIARKYGGTFILRIEDTDRTRSKRAFVEEIEDALAMLNIKWDEGPGVGGKYEPYSQSQRRMQYADAAEKLLNSGQVYRCFCSTDRLEELKRSQRQLKRPPRYDRKCINIPPEEATRRADEGEPYVLRFRLPDHGEVVLKDVLLGEIRMSVSALEDFVIRKSNGDFTFDLPNVVDDEAMRISLIVRGSEHITNTARHNLLREALGYTQVPFIHLPLILDAQKHKLSKRAGAVTIREFVELGVLPAAITNCLAMLGWHPGGTREIFTLPELVSEFTVERLSRSPSVFDFERLAYFHREHLQRVQYQDVRPRFLQFLGDLQIDETTALGEAEVDAAIFGEVQASGAFFSQAPKMFAFLGSGFAPPALPPEADVRLLAAFAQHWGAIGEARAAGDPKKAKALLDSFMQAQNVASKRDLLHPLRLALTGEEKGVSLYLVLALLTPQAVESRIQSSLGR